MRHVIKKIFGTIMSLALVLGLVSGEVITAKAASAVCQVRETPYANIEEAINDWVTSRDESQAHFLGGTLKLLTNVEVSSTTTARYSYNLELDLDKYTYKYTGDSNAFVIGDSYGPTLTVKGADTGLLDATGKTISLTHGSTFVLESGTVKGDIKTDSVGGSVRINGGTVVGNISISEGSMYINDGVIDGNLSFGHRGNITGGKITGTVSGSVAIAGGYFKIKPSEDLIFNGYAIEEKKKQKDWKYSDCSWRVVRAESIVEEPEDEPEDEPTETDETPTEETVKDGYVRDITGTKEVTSDSNVYNLKIVNSNELKNLLSLTDAEMAEGVNVWLDVKDIGDKVSETDKKLVEKALNNYKVGAYLDVNLFKKIGNKEATKVSSLNGKLKVSFLLPENLRKYGKNLAIVRVHDGEATVIKGTYDEKTYMFTFETDKFSTYALTYAASPQTGEAGNLAGIYVLMLASLIGLGMALYSRKRS